MKNVLFVDDEAMVLKLYELFFKQKKDEWNSFICSEPQLVNQICSENPIDIIVCDYNMPNINGAQVLKQVIEDFPWIIRIIITASSNEVDHLKALKYAHRCLQKPIKLAEIENEIENSYTVYKSEISHIIRTTITGLDTLPVMPKLYSELIKELKKGEDSSLKKIAKLISNDPNMSINILKIINSPFFKKDKEIFKAEHAVTMLGMNIVKNLVLSAELIKIFPLTSENEKIVESIIHSGTLCAELMKKIFDYEYSKGNVSKSDIDTAETIGMLHDVGRIVLASLYPALYKDITNIKSVSDEELIKLEKDVIGVNHAEVATYLFSLWGIPRQISKAIEFHANTSQIIKSDNKFIKAIRFINYVKSSVEHNKLLDVEKNKTLKANSEWFNVVLPELNQKVALITKKL